MRIPRPVSVLGAVTCAVVGLLFLMAFMASVQTQAAPLGEGTGDDPRIEGVTVTSDLPIADTRPGDGVNKVEDFCHFIIVADYVIERVLFFQL